MSTDLPTVVTENNQDEMEYLTSKDHVSDSENNDDNNVEDNVKNNDEDNDDNDENNVENNDENNGENSGENSDENNGENSDENSGDENSGDESSGDESSKEEPSTITNLSLKSGTDIFILSVDGIPQFYAKTLKDARDRMWDFAKLRRLQETQYNTYIRACPDKNRIEVVGSNKFSIFFVDRTICWLRISQVQELEVPKEEVPKEEVTKEEVTKEIDESINEPQIDSAKISPPKRGFIASLFGW